MTDVMADAAVRATIQKLVPDWLNAGGDLDGLKVLMFEVESLADGKATAPSAAAIQLYAMIRERSKGSADQIREFLGLIGETLRHVETAERIGDPQ